MWEAWYDVALAPNSGPWRNWRRVLVRPCDGGCGRKVAAYIDDVRTRYERMSAPDGALRT